MSVVRVRNDNSSITYVGDWSIVQAATVNLNNLENLINGPPFSPTLHSTTTTSSFIFPFHGSTINVKDAHISQQPLRVKKLFIYIRLSLQDGKNLVTRASALRNRNSCNIANLAESSQDPSWTCAVDGINLELPNLSSVNGQNVQTMCMQGGITDGAHELVVNVTSQGMPFYLDFLDYTSSPNISLENSMVLVLDTDPGVDFISGWGNIGVGKGTTDPEGLVNVTFIGVQLAWYGDIPFSQPHTNASSGIFSVDGQPFTSFQIPGLAQQFSATAFNQLIFTTPMLKMGTHVLSAKYTGSSGQSPFTFEYLVVTNGSFSSTNSTPTSSSLIGGTTRSAAPPTNSSNNSSHVGGIVGGVVGGVGGILVCTVILLFWLRSRRRNGKNRGAIEPFSGQPQFVSSVAPLLVPNQTAGNQGMSSTHYSQPSMSTFPHSTPSSSNLLSPYAINLKTLPNLTLSSSNSVSPYVANLETFSGSSRPLPTPPQVDTQFIAPRPRKGAAPIGATSNTIIPVQHEDSGIRLSQPSVEIPPIYSPS